MVTDIILRPLSCFCGLVENIFSVKLTHEKPILDSTGASL